MKNYIILLLILSYSTSIFCQKEEHLEILIADSTWNKETLKMPLSFAKDINYEGFEDIRFAEGWAKNESPEFWTYTFAWHIKGIQKQTTENLEKHIKLYFDGLMLPPNNDEQKLPEALVLFIENENSNLEADFIGKIKTYDRFHTKKPITLNCTVKSIYCEVKNTSTIVFRISPQALGNAIWKKFEDIKLSESVCTN